MTTNDASYFPEPGKFTIQWNGGRCILERMGEDAERLIQAVAGKDSDSIREILKAEISGATQ